MVSSTVDYLFNLLNNYYDNLIPGNRSEIPFKKELDKYTPDILMLGLPVLLYKLQTEAKDEEIKYFCNNHEEKYNRYLISHALLYLPAFVDLVDYVGENGIFTLLSILDNPDSHEDLRALVALCLASQSISSKLKPDINNLLLKIYNNCEGTGCRMSLAYTMHIFGYSTYLKSFLTPYFFFSKSHLEHIISALKNYGGFTEEQIYGFLYQEIFQPNSSGQFKVQYVEYGLPEMVILDIATEGKVFQNKDYSWKRKKYA